MNLSKYILIKNKRFPFGTVFMVILGIFLFYGFSLSSSNYGKYQRSQEVAKLFEKGDFPSSYVYYYAHTVSRPEALIGIDSGYALDNDLWTKVDSTQLKHLMDNIWIRSGFSPFTYGSYMVSPQGKTIGIYYSKWSGGPIVMGPDNKVNVNLPYVRDEDHEGNGFILIK